MRTRHLLALTATILLFSCNILAQTQFLAAPQYATGGQPRSIAAADFNGDGNLDLVTADYASQKVSILLGKPDGNFQPKVDYFAGMDPRYVTAGDFNGDGKVDLAVAVVTAKAVSVLMGNGDGTFAPHIKYPAGSNPYFVATADLNGDGRPDLVAVNEGSNNVSVLLGNGDGTFQARANYGVGTHPWAVAIGDYNSDGKPDLAVVNIDGDDYSVLLGNGNGTFQAKKDYATGAQPLFVAASDVNADGVPDLLICAYEGSSIAVHLGKGDGTFQAALYSPVVKFQGPHHLVVADFNGDGKPDMAVPDFGFYSSGSTLNVLLGNGDGTFQPHVDFGTGYSPASAVAADFNHDGKIDLATTDLDSNTASVLIGNGNGTFRARRDFDAGSSPTWMAAGDFNSDGKPDLAVAAEGPGVISILINNGDGGLQSPRTLDTGTTSYSVAAADVNGDGKVDLGVANASDNSVSVLLGNGDATFQPAVKYPTVAAAASLNFVDLNRDGRLDLVVVTSDSYATGSIDVMLGDGDGTFQPSVYYPVGQTPLTATAGDLNGDGIPDLVVPDLGYPVFSNAVSVLIGNGDGTFKPRVDYTANEDPTSAVIADFNRDGKADMAVSTLHGVDVFLGKGDGTFSASVEYPTSSSGLMYASDLNGDGYLDLVVGALEVDVLLGKADGTFSPYTRYIVVGTSGFLLADMNSDGSADVAGADVYGSTLSVLLNARGSQIRLTSQPNPSKLGQEVTFRVTVTGSLPGQPLPGGTVTIKDAGNVLSKTTLSNGRVEFKTSSLTLGTHTITALYSGDTNFNPSQISIKQVVKAGGLPLK